MRRGINFKEITSSYKTQVPMKNSISECIIVYKTRSISVTSALQRGQANFISVTLYKLIFLILLSPYTNGT